MDAHVVRWHPFRMHLGPVGAGQVADGAPEWGEPPVPGRAAARGGGRAAGGVAGVAGR